MTAWRFASGREPYPALVDALFAETTRQRRGLKVSLLRLDPRVSALDEVELTCGREAAQHAAVSGGIGCGCVVCRIYATVLDEKKTRSRGEPG